MQSLAQTQSSTEVNNLSLNRQTIATAEETTSIAGHTNKQVQSSSNPEWAIFLPKNDAKIFKVGKLYVGHLDEVPVPGDIRKKWETNVITRLEDHLLLTTQKLGNSIPSKDTMIEAQLCMTGKQNNFLLRRNDSSRKTDVALRPTVWISCGSSKCKRKVGEEIGNLLYLTHFLNKYHMDRPHISRGGPWPCARQESQQNLPPGVPIEQISFAVRQPLPGLTKFPSICGTIAMFTIHTTQGDIKRSSTVGGLICVDGQIFGLTTGHAVITECLDRNTRDHSESANDSPSSSDSGSESNLSTTRESKQMSDVKDHVSPSDRWIALQFPKVLAYLRSGTTAGDWRFTENAPETSDFALFDPEPILFNGVTNSYLQQNSDPTIISDHLLSHELSAGEVFVISSCGDVPLRGQLLDGNPALIIKGTIIRTRKIRIGRSASEGLSGSWIVRKDKLCGIVYAAYDRSPYLHMIPAETILNDIKGMLRVSEARVATEHDISVLMKINHSNSPTVSTTVQDLSNKLSHSLIEDYGSIKYGTKQSADERGNVKRGASHFNSPLPRTVSTYGQTLTYGSISPPNMSQPPEQEWSSAHQRWLQKNWSPQYERWYWNQYVDGQGWVFFDWVPLYKPVTEHNPYSLRVDSGAAPQSAQPGVQSRQAPMLYGTWDHQNSQADLHYEPLDPAFYVRTKEFFTLGKVFSVLFTEPAASNVTNYNDSISLVKYGEHVHTQVRRFIVVSPRRAHCYAIPIFTYGNQGTKKPGVEPGEHAIAYSSGSLPHLLPGELPLEKDPICIVLNHGERPLSQASRIFFGIGHPIQYNVKVKDMGNVHPEHLVKLVGYWAMENQQVTNQAVEVTADAAFEGVPEYSRV